MFEKSISPISEILREFRNRYKRFFTIKDGRLSFEEVQDMANMIEKKMDMIIDEFDQDSEEYEEEEQLDGKNLIIIAIRFLKKNMMTLLI